MHPPSLGGSRLLARLDADIRKSTDPVETACLRAERAGQLARLGQIDQARQEVADAPRRRRPPGDGRRQRLAVPGRRLHRLLQQPEQYRARQDAASACDQRRGTRAAHPGAECSLAGAHGFRPARRRGDCGPCAPGARTRRCDQPGGAGPGVPGGRGGLPLRRAARPGAALVCPVARVRQCRRRRGDTQRADPQHRLAPRQPRDARLAVRWRCRPPMHVMQWLAPTRPTTSATGSASPRSMRWCRCCARSCIRCRASTPRRWRCTRRTGSTPSARVWAGCRPTSWPTWRGAAGVWATPAARCATPLRPAATSIRRCTPTTRRWRTAALAQVYRAAGEASHALQHEVQARETWAEHQRLQQRMVELLADLPTPRLASTVVRTETC